MKRHPLVTLFITMFLDMFVYGIMIPLIPILLNDPSSPDYLLPIGMDISTGYILLGILLGIQPLMQFFSAPIVGQLSDKYGRRPLLMISLSTTCFSHALFAYAIMVGDLPLLFIARAIDGITGGNISVIQAATADISSLKERIKNFGIISAAFGLGFISGPFIGGILSDSSIVSWFTISTPFWLAVILSAFNVFLVWKFLKETNSDKNEELNMSWFNSINHIKKAITIPGMRSIFSSQFLFYTGFSFFTTFFSVFLINTLNYNQSKIGYLFAYVGIWFIITQLIIIRYLLKDARENRVLPISLLIAGFGAFILLTVNSTFSLYLTIPIFAVAIGITIVNTTGIISKSASPKIQGEILGIGASVQALAQSISPIISGFIGTSLGYFSAYFTPLREFSVPNTVLFISGSLMILASIVFAVFHNRMNKKLKKSS